MVSGRQSGSGSAPIRYGMVGGGQGAFIGAVHRIAARMDGEFELVAGALSSEPARAKASAAELGLDPARSYGSFQEMARAEAKRPDGIEAVAIVTPNNVHYPAAKAFLEAGIHVICDKPLTSSLADAKKLAALVEKSGRLFVLTHNYTGYPMVRQAREMVAGGQARPAAARAGGISAGLAHREDRGERPEAGGLAGGPEAVGRRRVDRRHRHARLQPRPLRFGTASSIRSRPTSTVSSPGARSTTTRISCCASRAAPKA